jgi:hypothetical protein
VKIELRLAVRKPLMCGKAVLRYSGGFTVGRLLWGSYCGVFTVGQLLWGVYCGAVTVGCLPCCLSGNSHDLIKYTLDEIAH